MKKKTFHKHRDTYTTQIQCSYAFSKEETLINRRQKETIRKTEAVSHETDK